MELYSGSLDCEYNYLGMFERMECTAVGKKLARVLCRGCGCMFIKTIDMFGYFANAKEEKR